MLVLVLVLVLMVLCFVQYLDKLFWFLDEIAVGLLLLVLQMFTLYILSSDRQTRSNMYT